MPSPPSTARPPSPTPPAARRRTIRKAAPLIILLIAGATLNVAVAWGCCLVGTDFEHSSRTLSTVELQGLRESGWSPPPASPDFLAVINENRLENAGVCYTERYETEALRPDYGRSMRRIVPVRHLDVGVFAGWPFASIEGRSEAFDATPGQPWRHRSNVMALRGHGERPLLVGARDYSVMWPPEPIAKRSMLPIKPLWPGFAINTLFYAGVFWVMFCGPFALRRTIRRRRGHCPACAYPIGQSPICTECGADLDIDKEKHP